MTDLFTTILIILGTQVPAGYAKVECPWAQAREIHEPHYVDNMPKFYLGPSIDVRPNPDYYEFTCVRPIAPLRP